MIVHESQGVFHLESWPAYLWCGQKVRWLSTGAYSKPFFMYEEGEISFPEVCHKRSVLLQHLCSY